MRNPKTVKRCPRRSKSNNKIWTNQQSAIQNRFYQKFEQVETGCLAAKKEYLKIRKNYLKTYRSNEKFFDNDSPNYRKLKLKGRRIKRKEHADLVAPIMRNFRRMKTSRLTRSKKEDLT